MTMAKSHLLGSAAALITVAGIHMGVARAEDTPEDVQRQLNALRHRVEQIEGKKERSERDQKEAIRAANVARAEAEKARKLVDRAQTASSDLKGALPGSIRIPGTGTSLAIHGFAELDANRDFGPRNRSVSISVPSIPLAFAASGAKVPGDFSATAANSRFSIETLTPINEIVGNVYTKVELDLAGQTNDLTTQASTSSFTPRLRLAFGEFGQPNGWGLIRTGQAWSLYSDAPLVPIRSVTSWTILGESAVRQAAVQYTKSFSGTGEISVGVENSYSDITSTLGTSYPDSNGGAGLGRSGAPDLTARARWDSSLGFFALRGMVRRLEINNGAAVPTQRYDAAGFGYGIGASGVVRLIDGRLRLSASTNYGTGIGRYLNTVSSGFGAVTNFGIPGIDAQSARLDAVTAAAGVIGAQYDILPNLQTNVLLAGAGLEYPNYASSFVNTQTAVNKSMWAATANLIYTPLKNVDVGLEYQHAERKLLAPVANGASSGTADRLNTMVRVSF